jgi:hypothetical protein
MADGQIVSFKIGEAFPADDQLARWMTVYAMALNDLLLINRWLIPRLQGEVIAEPHETFHLGRLAAAHLFEAATFLRKSDKQLAVVRDFVAKLDEEPRAAYADLLAIGEGGQGRFAKQLKHARNMVFHYQALLTGQGEEHERLKQAMRGHADDEREQGIKRGKVEDIPPALTGFRSLFADDIATEMLLPEDTEQEMSSFLGNVAEHSAKLMIFGKPAFNAYTQTKPEAWEIENIPSGKTSDP